MGDGYYQQNSTDHTYNTNMQETGSFFLETELFQKTLIFPPRFANLYLFTSFISAY